MRNNILLFLSFLMLWSFSINAQDSTIQQTFTKEKVYLFKLQDEIDAPAWRMFKIAMEAAKKQNVDVFIVNLNTYGGRVDFADSIRSALLNYTIPTVVFIESNAASAGALISIACDSIYMSPGSTIGAATVVDGNGTKAAEKYQSFFRAKMRATASENKRNPDIAEAMVDASKSIPGIVDENTLITFTVEEAIKNNYCEGKFNNVQEMISSKYPNAKTINHEVTTIEKIILFLINPVVSGLLIVLIIGGIYLEVQSPGIGFPIIISAIGATLFFAPLYLQGLANNWEIILFFIGLALIAAEIFIIPGFGVAGILGLLFVISSLALSLISIVPSDIGLITPSIKTIINSFAIVTVSIVGSIVLSFLLSKKLLLSKNVFSDNMVLTADGKESKFNLSKNFSNEDLIGKTGVTSSRFMPSGKVLIDDELFDAIASNGFLNKDETIIVSKISNGQLVVKKVK